MRVLWRWLRRSTAFVVLPALVAFTMILPWGRPGWEADWDWGVRTAALGTIFFAPIVAALAAFDMSRRFRASLFDLAGGARRGPRAVVIPAMAAWLCAMVACAASWVMVAVSVTLAHGLGPRDGWVYVEYAAVMLAAASIGGFFGSLIRGVLAAPTAALAVYSVGFFTQPYGLQGVLSVVSNTGTSLGFERNPERALHSILINALIALTFLLLSVWRSTPSARWLVTSVLAAVLTVSSIAYAIAMPPKESEYQLTTEPAICLGRAPRVCGPQSGRPLLRPVQADLQASLTELKGSTLVWPDTFVMSRSEKIFPTPSGAAVFELTPGDVRDGHYTRGALATALAQPRLCTAFFDEDVVEPYLEASDRLKQWLIKELSSTASTQPAPVEIRRDFMMLSTCQQARASE